MSENVKYYFKKDCTERCPHIKDGPDIGSVFCLYICKYNIKKDRDSGWIICERLNEEVWRKKSAELIIKLHRERLISDLSGNILWDRIKKNKTFSINLTDLIETCKKANNSFKLLNQTLNKMKKENINIEIPKGYVPEIKDGKVTLVYKGNPLDEMPKSWEELEKVSGEYINEDAEIEGTGDDCLTDEDDNKNIIPKGLGRPMLALIQLLQLRNRTWEVTNSKPTCDCPWVITYNGLSDILERFTSSTNHSMKFSSEVVALRFLEYHKDLLWEARELL